MIKKFLNKFLGEKNPLEMRLFHITLLGALLTCFLATIGSFLGRAPMMSTLVVLGVLLFLVILGIVIHRVGRYIEGCNIAIIIITVIVYPVIYTTGGGLDSGMSVYWVLLIVMTFIIMKDKKNLTITVFLQASLFIVMVITENNHPEIIIRFSSDKSRYIDVINAVIISAISIGLVIKFQSEIYLKESSKAEDAVLFAKEANNAKSLFLANMSHEIRTPMNAILGMIELILRAEINEDVREKAHNIQNASASLLSIINDILDFSKIESGKMIITLERYQFTSVINDVVNMISLRLIGKDVELYVIVDPKIPSELMGDQIRIRQILINLLNNAVKFTHSGSITISVGCRFRHDAVLLLINVADTGIGIKKENIDKMFRSFERVGEYEHRNIEGTGLGLAICKQLLELMGGSIVVQSEFGNGSTFSVLLPQKIVSREPMVHVDYEVKRKILVLEKTRKHADILKSSLIQLGEVALIVDSLERFKAALVSEEYTNIFISKGMFEKEEIFIRNNCKNAKLCILIDYNAPIISYENVIVIKRPICCMTIAAVFNGDNSKLNYSSIKTNKNFMATDAEIIVIDDNLINLEVIKGLLNYYKINVTVAKCGYEGLKLLKNPKYDLVLLDYMMPELDGIETIRLLRKCEGDYYKNIPVIALTANAVSGAREMFINEGFQDYIPKPIDISKLEMVLTSYLPNDMIKLTEMNYNEKIVHESKIPRISGIDSEIGIRNCNGNRYNFLKVLSVVVLEGKEKCDILKRYCKEQNYERYMVEAHGVKGAMASIGAVELSELAKEHEYAGKEENYDFIDQNMEEFIKNYEELINNIELFLQSQEDQEVSEMRLHIDSIKIREELVKIKIMLEDYDSSTAEAKSRELLSYDLDENMSDYMKELRKKIDKLEYEDAIELIKNYLQEM